MPVQGVPPGRLLAHSRGSFGSGEMRDASFATAGLRLAARYLQVVLGGFARLPDATLARDKKMRAHLYSALSPQNDLCGSFPCAVFESCSA